MSLPPALLARPIFSAAEARACGVTASQLREAARAGVIHRLRRGWWTARTVDRPVDAHVLRTGAEVRVRPMTVPASWSGAVMLGLPVLDVDLGTVHLRRKGDGAPRCGPGLVVHQAVGVSVAADDEPAQGSRMASLVPLTRADAARICTELALASPVSGLMSMDAAIRAGRLRLEEIAAWRHVFRGRPGAPSLEAVLGQVDARRESPGESWMCWECHLLGYQLETQVPVEGRRGSYRLDAAILGEWVALEYDGEKKYSGGTGNAPLLREKVREDDVRDAGWEVVRVTRRKLRALPTLHEEIEDARARARRRRGGRSR